MTTQLLWSLDEAAKAMGGISARTVRRLIQTGELQAIRIRGCAPRIRPEDVQTWIEQNIACDHNDKDARGKVPNQREVAQCQKQQKGYTNAQIRHTCGSPTQMPMVSEFGVLLGFSKPEERKRGEKRKHC
jgi:excisionase family DNA binding protein